MSTPHPYSQKQKFGNIIVLSKSRTLYLLMKSVSGSLHRLLSQLHVFPNDHHDHKTRGASNGLLKISTNNASIYGTKNHLQPRQ